MERNRQIAAIAESEEERMLLIRVCDRLERAQQRQTPAATAFLSQREQALLRMLLPECRFFGGIAEAERKVAYWLPDYIGEEDFFADGPIACLRASFYEENALTHRDVLGALMGAGLRRDAVGDIWLHETFCDIFILSDLERYLLDNLTAAGRQHLRLAPIALCEARKAPQKMKELRLTVSSLRLDGVISAAFHMSRSSACDAIRAGKAAVNSLTCLKPDRAVAEGDELSVRGCGKGKILHLDGETRKGRLALTVGIYG
ncbi:MAG: RNA-binding protein [Oscillospiraceae bacterium]|nr:RNA-binding protein [Oscillospiraceae bacterium]